MCQKEILMTRSIAFIAACVVMMSAANVFAGHIPCASCVTQPTSLNPGDEYRLAFVSFDGPNATSSNIATYNTFVNNAGNDVTELAALNTSPIFGCRAPARRSEPTDICSNRRSY